MAHERLTRIGALLADETRARVLTVLTDGRARTGGELARYAGVAPSTASEHLSRLLDAGLVRVDAQGRHRYFQLAGAEVAELLEGLGAVRLPEPWSTAPSSRAVPELTRARACYDHLAGELAVEIYDRLLAGQQLRLADQQLTITPSGEALLAGLGVDVGPLRRAKRPVARSCLDWTERRHHLAGGAGAALFNVLLARRWIVQGSRPRSIRVTQAGKHGLDRAFGPCCTGVPTGGPDRPRRVTRSIKHELRSLSRGRPAIWDTRFPSDAQSSVPHRPFPAPRG